MKTKLVTFTLGLILSTSIFSQQEIAGVKLPATLKSADQSLVLNGGALREKWFLDLYVGALYLTSKTSDGNKIAADDEPMVMRIELVSILVTSEKMANATYEGFEKSTNNNTAPLKADIDRFVNIFKKEPIVDKDIFEIIYTPNKGVSVTKNGKDQGVIIAGLVFKKALFGMWIGDNPVDDDLKEGLLGN